MDTAMGAGAEKSGGRYPIRLSEGLQAKVGHLPVVKRLGQLAGLSMLLLIEKGDEAQAAVRLRELLSLARSLEQEPLFLSQLVRRDLLRMACRGLERWLARGGVSAEAGQSIESALAAAEQATATAWLRCFVVEQVMAEHLVRLGPEKVAAELGVGGGVFTKSLDVDLLKQNFKRDREVYLETVRTLVKMQTTDWPGRLKAREYAADQTKLAERHKLQMTLARVGVPPGTAEAEITARLRIARLALAAARRSATSPDELPAAIEAFAGEVSPDSILDPFTGKPLRYEKEAGWLRISSAGAGRSDPTTGHGGGGVLSCSVRLRAERRSTAP